MIRIILGWLFLALVPALAKAGTVEVQVLDAQGMALPDAAVALLSEREGDAAPVSVEAVMDQRDQAFIPYVLAVQSGTLVRFPNSDNIRHHVYSFSPAKRFELRLYHGTTADPVLFDTAGTVILGCNIHDTMLAYIYVIDSPWFAVTGEEGRMSIAAVPTGTYEVRVQHPRLAEPMVRSISVASGEPLFVEMKVEKLGPDPRRKPPASELQQLFRPSPPS